MRACTNGVPVSVAVAALTACASLTTVRWTIDATAVTSVRWVRAELHAGSCADVGALIEDREVARPDTTLEPFRVGPGAYAVVAVGIDAGCMRVAEACAEIAAPAPSTMSVTLTLAPASSMPVCDADVCMASSCMGAQDAAAGTDACVDGTPCGPMRGCTSVSGVCEPVTECGAEMVEIQTCMQDVCRTGVCTTEIVPYGLPCAPRMAPSGTFCASDRVDCSRSRCMGGACVEVDPPGCEMGECCEGLCIMAVCAPP